MKRTILYFLFSLALCFSIMPTPVHAQSIHGLDLTEINSFEKEIGGGTAIYDKENHKLILNNVTIRSDRKAMPDGQSVCGIVLPNDNFTIELKGNNQISNFTTGVLKAGTSGNVGNLTIIGDGTLNIVECDFPFNDIDNLSIQGVTLNSTSALGGIDIYNKFEAKNANLNIEADGSNTDPGPYSRNCIEATSIIFDKCNVSLSSIYGNALDNLGNNSMGDLIINDSTINTQNDILAYNMSVRNASIKSGNISVYNHLKLEEKVDISSKKYFNILDGRIEVGTITNNLNEKSNINTFVLERNTDTFYYLTDYEVKYTWDLYDYCTYVIEPGVTVNVAEGANINTSGKAKIINNGTIQMSCINKDAITISEGNEPLLQHDWKENWTWSSDGKSATLKFVCQKDATHIVEPKVTMSQETIKAPTCTSEGKMKYTATATFEGKKYSSDNTITVPITHTFAETFESDLDGHWHICIQDGCGASSPKEAHTSTLINAKEATTTEKGYTGDTVCSICGYLLEMGKEISKLPSIIEGANSKWTSGDLTFKLNDQLDDPIEVLVDDQAIDAKNYILKEGIEITLKQDYLSTLSQGKHTLSIVSKNGTATTTFEVKPTLITNTGDSPLIMYHALLAAGSLVAILMLQSKRKSIIE